LKIDWYDGRQYDGLHPSNKLYLKVGTFQRGIPLARQIGRTFDCIISGFGVKCWVGLLFLGELLYRYSFTINFVGDTSVNDQTRV